ncbi:MAG: hypothetical protein IJG97_03250 [Bacilli bacterium]|nr:hypothetical protein [Bacilli bacterium]
MNMSNKVIRYFILTFLLVAGFALTIFGLTKSYISLGYSEDNSVSYNVFLKENNYFESRVLEENRTYITSIIDYIRVKYHYNLKFSENVNGEYSYYIQAVVSANKPNGDSGYYWQKKYNLVEPKTLKLNNVDAIYINEIVNVDYSKYDKILEEFKSDYSIQTDGLLRVELVVESDVTGEKYSDSIKIPSNLSMSIPLLQKAVEASIEKNAVSNDSTLTMIDPIAQKIKYACIVLGLIIIFLTIALIIRIIINRNLNRKRHLYESTLQKFVDSHDSIIANVTNLPDVSDLNVVEVSSFDELIDVYSEVRMPINFYENKDKTKAVFRIINDRMCWEYVLDKEKIEKNNRRKK